MPLNRGGLQSAILAALQRASAELDGAKVADAQTRLAADLTQAIDTYVRTATVSTTVAVTSVIGVTAGPDISGPGTGTGTGSLS